MGPKNKTNSDLDKYNLDEINSLDELITVLKKYEKTYYSIEGPINDPEAKKLALIIYKLFVGANGHQSDWNDCFYVAVRFGLDKELQKTAALNSVISNGISGYFEAITHENFHTANALVQLGVPTELIPPQVRGYVHTGYDLRKLIEKKFKIDLDNKEEIKKMQENYHHSQGVYLYDL